MNDKSITEEEMKIDVTQATLDLKPEARLFDFGDIHIAEHKLSFLDHDLHLLTKDARNQAMLGGDLINAESLAPFPSQPKNTLMQIEGEMEMLLNQVVNKVGTQISMVVWGNHEERLFRKEKSTVDILSGHLSIKERITRLNPSATVADLYRGIMGFITCGSQEYQIYIAHGSGHLRHMYWSEFDRAREVFPNMDVYVLHHAHQYNFQVHRWINPNKTLGRALYIRGGTYTPYMPYMEKMLLPPAELGAITLKFHPRKHRITFQFSR